MIGPKSSPGELFNTGSVEAGTNRRFHISKTGGIGRDGMTEKALEYIGRNRLEHMDMLESMRRGTARIICADKDGILIKDEPRGAHMINAKNPEAAARMLGMAGQRIEVLTAHQGFICPLAEEMFGLYTHMECRQAAWMRPEPPEQASCALDIRGVGMEYLDVMDAIYPLGDREYLSERIEQGEIYGAFDGRRLAAFIGTHTEGAMGMLEVDAAYRRQGLGAALFTFMTRRQLRLGRYAYSHIVSSNEPSLAMNRKYGFEIGRGVVYWMEEKVEI